MDSSLIPIIQTLGYLGVFGVIFAESGLLVGFMLPGDTLLFSAGLLAASGHFNLWVLIIGTSIAAILGDSVGYWIGKKAGPSLFRREESLFFKQEYLEKAKDFFAKHGVKTIVLARYVPIVRTFAPVVAGAAHMRYRTFLVFNIIGGVLWCTSLPLLGFYLGERIPSIDRYVLPVVGAIVVLSFVPMGIALLKRRLSR